MNGTDEYDFVILGGGAAAFAAIAEASSRELSAAIVNTGLPIDGTCVTVGCVPASTFSLSARVPSHLGTTRFDAVQYSEDEFSEAFKHACQAFRRNTGTMSCCVE